MSAIEITYTDPFTEQTPRKSQAWYNLRNSYLAFKIEIDIENMIVPMDTIARNPSDGGKWRWDTPLFEKEVDDLIEKIRLNNTFEAIWLKKEDDKISILDGHHRLAAWRKLGNETIPAVVVIVKVKETVYL